MRYLITCDVESSEDISIQSPSLGGEPYVSCPVGTLQVIEYSPTVSELTLTEINQYLAPIFMLVFVAWTLGLILKFLKSHIPFFK
ncbi:hypothetical protein [Thiomicrorhabdus sp.]|uniref:hypothetical protein n=1 Tax=Thiomicrorhabdus sp. TaxID=2039724 RepID=UPI0029C86485|nr:hypothetical protein [Thiomicrorhabdus sp.]